MVDAGVQKACIVQPILFLYDHSYVKAVMDKHPGKFKVRTILTGPQIMLPFASPPSRAHTRIHTY